MGILNLTEDSFSDGALFLDCASAINHAEQMIHDGAQLIDIGAESTRPGSIPVSEETELERVIPVLTALKKSHPEIIYSIDTQKASVAREAIKMGANIINDISALRYDNAMVGVIAAHPQVKVILMHMQGTPQNMQLNPYYDDVLFEIKDFFEERIKFCLHGGIKHKNILLDPGIGFGKTLEHNSIILAKLYYFNTLGLPMVLGASRKSFINMISPTPMESRLEGSLAAAAFAVLGGVEILRVHDVLAHKRFLDVFCHLSKAGVN